MALKTWLRKRITGNNRAKRLSCFAWSAQPLEPKRLLAADVGAEVGFALDLRGQTGEEFVRVWADDYLVTSTTLSTQWERLDFGIQDPGLRAKNIRLEFTNDLYLPDVGYDRNVFVGSLFLNGEVIDPNIAPVFSTTTWLPEDGIVAGSGRGSVMNSNGSFQFGLPTGSKVTVHAKGEEGGEQFVLLAGSTEFAPITVSMEYEAYDFYLNESIDVGSIRILFINDFYRPEEGFDFNLTLDRISLDQVTHQAEASTVFHAGVFRDGFLQMGNFFTETLHGNGHFQFNTETPNSPRYVLDRDVSEDGWIDLAVGYPPKTIARRDGSFVAVSYPFEVGPQPVPAPIVVESFNSSGNVDTNFNEGQALPFLPFVQSALGDSLAGGWFQPSELLVDSQDRLVVLLDVTRIGADGGFVGELLALRITRSGDLDTTFGTGGFVSFANNAPQGLVHFHLDRLDRLVASDGGGVLVRLDSNGNLDQGFGTGGVQFFTMPTPDSFVSQFTTRPDGSILVLTTRFRDDAAEIVGHVSQFNANGSIATSFGAGGVATIPSLGIYRDAKDIEYFTSMVLDDQGRIVLTGTNSVLRLNVNGLPDEGYGTHGIVKLLPAIVSDGQYFGFFRESGAVIDLEGRVVLARNGGFVRLNQLGDLDKTFSQDGYAAALGPQFAGPFTVNELQIDASGRLFSTVSTTRSNPAIGVWELV